MAISPLALANPSNLPIKCKKKYTGKVRTAYWLTPEDSARIIKEKGYNVHPSSLLGLMVIGDGISAFDTPWKSKTPDGDILLGVPGKGAILNHVSQYFSNECKKAGLGDNHILEVPHPLMWVVQRAKPIKVEFIYREYFTGSAARKYFDEGKRELCGINLPEGMTRNQKLPEIWYTPTTKGVLEGVEGVDEEEDAKVSPEIILKNFEEFEYKRKEDVKKSENMFMGRYKKISEIAKKAGYILVDAKFEGGYVLDIDGEYVIITIDEEGTQDAVRYWSIKDYQKFLEGVIKKIPQKSKEHFRGQLLTSDVIEDKRLLKGYKPTIEQEKTMTQEQLNELKELNNTRVDRVKDFANNNPVPYEFFMGTKEVYKESCIALTGGLPPVINDARGEILEVVGSYGLIVK
jgi:phosphoribosylaminoimidazole-succinocarboxamide synthase